MQVLIIFIVLIYVSWCSSISSIQETRMHDWTAGVPANNILCGLDNLPLDEIQEGLVSIEHYPWLGLLIYPIDAPSPTTTAVVLISRQIALSMALDIDFYPKNDFRARSRVILGNNCSGPYIRVRDYAFHPEFTRSTYTTLALLQLDTIMLGLKIFPICPPPEEFQDGSEIYAMTLINDCYNSSMVKVYKMDYVDPTQCRDFYRRIDLDIATMWPSHLACAQGYAEGHCIWRSGTVLVIRDIGQWKLLGLGIYGPGCQSPSRFLDYGMYHLWVKRSLERIGRPTVTRLADNHIILRRTTGNVQRYGICDPEEAKVEIYKDKVTYKPENENEWKTVKYNVTLVDNVEYDCIVLKAWSTGNTQSSPTLTLRRWCNRPKPKCIDPLEPNIHFYVQIKFINFCTFVISQFTSEMDYEDPKRLVKYNYNRKLHPHLDFTSYSYDID